MTASASSYRVSLRLYVMFSLLMAVSAAASGLLLLYLARPFIAELGTGRREGHRPALRRGRDRGGARRGGGALRGAALRGPHPRHRAEGRGAVAAVGATGSPQKVTDELGALDAAVGRLTLSMDQFVRDSDILARLPEGMLLVLSGGDLLSFNATAETLLGLALERFRGVPILAPRGLFPLGRGNAALGLGARGGGRRAARVQSEVAVTTAAAARSRSR